MYAYIYTLTASFEKSIVIPRSVPLELVHLMSRLRSHSPPILPGGISSLGGRRKSTLWTEHKISLIAKISKSKHYNIVLHWDNAFSPEYDGDCDLIDWAEPVTT